MRSAGEILARFPNDYVPPAVPRPDLPAADALSGSSIQELLSNPEVQTWVQDLNEAWPSEFLPLFLDSSSIVAQILTAFGVDRAAAPANLIELALFDPESRDMMLALESFNREADELSDLDEGAAPTDPLGFRSAVTTELLRRRLAHRAPFARTLSTLLGPDALLWLVAQSQEGVGKMQPHEFSRSNWCRLWEIETQTAIEQELLAVDPEAEHLSKIVVALAWTLVGLASFVPPAVFLEETTSHLLSLRGGQYTVASGTESRTLVDFHTSTMRSVVAVLADGLTNPLLTAADLMWMGAAIVRVRHVAIRHVEPVAVGEERFGLFLSHRGRDAKLPLSLAVRALPPTHGVFLDCLTLPRGVVNRSFIYGSLAHSDQIVIVDTEHYDESDWCRKEAWFCDALSRHGLASVERVDLSEAVSRVATDGGRSRRRRGDQRLQYPISERVLRDLDYWARRPNLQSLRETGFSVDAFETIQTMLGSEPRPDDAQWVEALGAAVAETTARVVNEAPDALPLDAWATAVQFSVAAFTSTSAGRSKDDVRRGIDQLNRVVETFVAVELHRDRIFHERASGYLALLAAASSIQLAGFDLDERLIPAMRVAVGGTAIVHDGLLLVDARERDARRAFHLQLIAMLIQGNLGSVGIVQNAHDEVHQQRVDGISLEVLPCVTLHPGIDAPYAFPSARRG